ncbi:MAG: hypothetical protein FWB84_06935 [Candidatus Bathyarchaeota archaeon]|uniref:hypothetical protein n=1 Tax=Candidatus Bathycorpusculum sp. TaxID=2994959 RepID=UPI002839D847|nr:hypothetical protein [Candidatus Termiticorpusculum sp.]MCL2257042.1 hypothetical protein [Candidatus Termiticorpusculum sp.]MCL2292832.1 hypothetical protein [Candidatus Termiticorpusculum sp.]
MIEIKDVTVALGVLCIMLVTSTVILFNEQQNTKYLEEQVSILNVQAIDLQDNVDNLNGALSEYEAQLSDYEKQIDDLTDKTANYTRIIDLKEIQMIFDNKTCAQEANTLTTVFNETVNYAGYFEFQVESTSDTTYLQTTYKHNDLNFNQTITVGTNSTAYFPILPGTVEVLIGNTGTKTNQITITLNYVY